MTVAVELDRGTLLVRGLSADGGVGSLPVRWDPRVQAHRARALDYEVLRRELKRSSRPFVDRVLEARASERSPASWMAVDLRPYQDAALHSWKLADCRGVVVLPTGSGKTRLAVAAMAQSGFRTLCLVPTRALLEQWLRVVSQSYRGIVAASGMGSGAWSG